MQQLKRNGFKNRFAVVLLVLALSTCSLFAKGERRLAGKVKSIGPDSVTIEMANHGLQKIKITSATKFFKGKKPAGFSGMKVGDHAVFLAVPDSTTTSSAGATSSTSDVTASATTKPGPYSPSAANTQKDSISLGLGFTAVEASY
jgi:Cu/Ag efflux protein CusF